MDPLDLKIPPQAKSLVHARRHTTFTHTLPLPFSLYPFLCPSLSLFPSLSTQWQIIDSHFKMLEGLIFTRAAEMGKLMLHRIRLSCSAATLPWAFEHIASFLFYSRLPLNLNLLEFCGIVYNAPSLNNPLLPCRGCATKRPSINISISKCDNPGVDCSFCQECSMDWLCISSP